MTAAHRMLPLGDAYQVALEPGETIVFHLVLSFLRSMGKSSLAAILGYQPSGIAFSSTLYVAPPRLGDLAWDSFRDKFRLPLPMFNRIMECAREDG